jgi:SpoVK/Ycf46/Vps4 family AAA+-type ATPase
VSEELIASLAAAVDRAPGDLALRLHLADLLVSAGRGDEAVSQLAAVLQQDPGSQAARQLMSRALAPAPAEPPAPAAPAEPAASQPLAEPSAPAGGFDWTAAEGEVEGLVPPMFVDGSDASEEPAPDAFDVEASGVRLADVGGMVEVKARLEAAFLTPMRNPELRALYGKSMRGGLLLYGPPGCGKTFIARAVAGELGAKFLSVSLADVLDMWIGQSERNLHEIFEIARRNSPCVIFLDEVDAIGQKRSQLRNSAMRGTVNQLLSELDSVGSVNEGVFVLAATNHPWDVDVALRRPGRFDRTLLVLPPDQPARAAILQYHLKDRPVAGIELGKLAARTDGYSGADLAHLCETAAERAMLDSVQSGSVRMIGMADFEYALGDVRPSIGPWLDTARNVAMFANSAGEYDDLLAYLKKRKLV